MLKYILLGAMGAIVVGLVWVRLAPSDPARWHTITLPVGAAGELTAAGSHTVLRDVTDGTMALDALDAIIMATPRTRRLAGSVEDGQITYVTRSRILGMPDYTTIAARPAEGGASVAIYGRLRFGKADLGVNKARIDRWLTQLDEALT